MNSDQLPNLELFRSAHPVIASGETNVHLAMIGSRNIGGAGEGIVVNVVGDAIDSGLISPRSIDVTVELDGGALVELHDVELDGGPFGFGHTARLSELSIPSSRIPELDDVLSGKAHLADMFKPPVTVIVKGDVLK